MIITSRALLPAAVDLRDFRRSPARTRPYRTAVATVEDIYREFASGRPACAGIRDFLKAARAGWGRGGPASLSHVLLLGDGHYDYRGIRIPGGRGGQVPACQLEAGSEGVATDDYYGWLDAGEGWFGSLLDLAVGRVPAGDLPQARAYVAKAAEHEDAAGAGEWRSRVILSADDFFHRDGSGSTVDGIGAWHLGDAEELGATIQRSRPGLAVDKLYLHDYPMDGAGRKPEASKALLAALNRGALAFHYVGHGSPNQLADEVLLQTEDALSRLRNPGRYPLFSAFSCAVGHFDGAVPGMSETMVVRAGQGAIAAIGATRETFAHLNRPLSYAFYRNLFRGPDTAAPATLGEALRLAKQGQDGVNSAKYVLFGEPVLALQRPSPGPLLATAPDTLKALGCGTLEGAIPGGSGNGKVRVRILGSPIGRSLPVPGTKDTLPSERRGPILFERTLDYRGHRFSTPYFLPRQVPFGDTAGSIQVFAWDAARPMEGQAALRGLRIEGTSTGSCASDPDGRGPAIRITGCEAKEAGEVDFPERVWLPLPYCLRIHVEDSSGGVMSAEGPDEGTTVEVHGILDPFHPAPDLDELERKTYQVALNTPDARPGAYVLKVSARDGFGNLGLRQLRMDLTLDSSLTVLAAYNVPNPVKRGGTTFHFNMVLPKEDGAALRPGESRPVRMTYQIRIFDQAGRQVALLRGAESGRTRWDGRDDWGSRAANGVYFYVVTGSWASQGGSSIGYRTLHSRRNVLVLSR